MTHDEMLAYLRAANEVAREAQAAGHHPFGAVLVGPAGEVLMSQGNIDTVRHAETEMSPPCRRRVIRGVSLALRPRHDVRAVRHVRRYALLGEHWNAVYGAAETVLLALTGDDPQNPTMHLPARTVLGSGQKKITVHGPIPDLEEELVAPHRDFWRK